MLLSEVGEIVDSCWRKIPEHFADTKMDTYRVMPNHVHGVIVIKDHPVVVKNEPVGVEYIQSLPRQVMTNKRNLVGAQHAAPLQGTRPGCHPQPVPGSLNAIVRSFKSAATKEIHDRGLIRHSIWHRSFHDHIIRDDVDHFFVSKYIELNPILWDLDFDNPMSRGVSIDDLREELKTRHGLTGFELERVIEYEMGYRMWSEE